MGNQPPNPSFYPPEQKYEAIQPLGTLPPSPNSTPDVTQDKHGLWSIKEVGRLQERVMRSSEGACSSSGDSRSTNNRKRKHLNEKATKQRTVSYSTPSGSSPRVTQSPGTSSPSSTSRKKQKKFSPIVIDSDDDEVEVIDKNKALKQKTSTAISPKRRTVLGWKESIAIDSESEDVDVSQLSPTAIDIRGHMPTYKTFTLSTNTEMEKVGVDVDKDPKSITQRAIMVHVLDNAIRSDKDNCVEKSQFPSDNESHVQMEKVTINVEKENDAKPIHEVLMSWNAGHYGDDSADIEETHEGKEARSTTGKKIAVEINEFPKSGINADVNADSTRTETNTGVEGFRSTGTKKLAEESNETTALISGSKFSENATGETTFRKTWRSRRRRSNRSQGQHISSLHGPATTAASNDNGSSARLPPPSSINSPCTEQEAVKKHRHNPSPFKKNVLPPLLPQPRSTGPVYVNSKSRTRSSTPEADAFSFDIGSPPSPRHPDDVIRKGASDDEDVQSKETQDTKEGDERGSEVSDEKRSVAGSGGYSKPSHSNLQADESSNEGMQSRGAAVASLEAAKPDLNVQKNEVARGMEAIPGAKGSKKDVLPNNTGQITSPKTIDKHQVDQICSESEVAVVGKVFGSKRGDTKDAEKSKPEVNSPAAERKSGKDDDFYDHLDPINLPAELAPFNRPGRRDYAIVLPSRLRSRNKKENEDIPYLHVSGQQRCKAMLNQTGIWMSDGASGSPCTNCAVGISRYCSVHSGLERDSEEKGRKNDRSILNEKKACESDEVPLEAKNFVRNAAAQCAALDSEKLPIKVRCSGKTKSGNYYCHVHLRQDNRLQEGDNKADVCNVPHSMCCIALTKQQKKCHSMAVIGSVFCARHLRYSPKQVILLAPSGSENSESKISGEHMDGGSRLDCQNENQEQEAQLTMGSKAQCEHKSVYGDRCCYEACDNSNLCRMHYRKSRENFTFSPPEEDEWNTHLRNCPPLTLRTSTGTEQLRFSTDARRVSSREERCIFLVQNAQCDKRAVPGYALCPLHWDYRKKGVSIFDVEMFQTASSSSEEVESAAEAEAIMTKLSESRSGSTFNEGSNSTDDDIETDHSSESDDDDDDSHSVASTYDHSEFKKMWRAAETIIGEDTEKIESSQLCRAANAKMNPTDSDRQLKAQYGRLLPNAMKKMMTLLELSREDVFLDIGHGIGNTCLHVAFCVGCEARGIEVVCDRYNIGEVFRGHLVNSNRIKSTPRDIGKIDLRLGRLEDPKNRDFLTRGVTRAYVNNFNGVFADRSNKNNQTWFLDNFVAGLFALMAPGSIMITFHRLDLGLDRDEANDLRKRHGMKESENASFYTYTKEYLGKAYKTVKWTQRSGNREKIYVYKYRRVIQPAGEKAVFLCSNKKCENAISEIPIPATKINDEGQCVINHCKCNYSPKSLRTRPRRFSSS